MPEILHTLRIESTPAKIYKALTTQDGLRSWWTRFTMAEPTVGYINEFGFGGAFKFRMHIEDLITDELIQWTCIDGHEEWEGTHLEFTLQSLPDTKATLVHFKHTNWNRNDGVLPQCSYDWAQYLRSLKMYIEAGKGLPT